MSGDDGESSKRVRISPCLQPQSPPVSPYLKVLDNHPGDQKMGSQSSTTSNLGGPSLTRSSSQPLYFARDYLHYASNEQRGEIPYSLLPPSPFSGSSNCSRLGERLQAHRRSNSVSFPFSKANIPVKIPGALDALTEGRGNNNIEWMGKGKCEMVNVDEDVFSTYMNLDYVGALNPSGAEDECGNEVQESLDSRDKVNGGDSSENEGVSCVDESGGDTIKIPGVSSLPEMSEGGKRIAAADVSQTNRHFRSVSADSFIGNINLVNELLDIPVYPGILPAGQLLSPSTSSELNSNAISLVLGNVEFNGGDLNKIMANEKLTEIALRDPRRAKRILSNRKSAARSKERKMRYVAELENRVLTLQNETTMLAAQLAQLERESDGLTSQNKELKLRLQALEQQTHLQDALKEALTGELQRLKLANEASSKFRQCSIDSRMLQLFKKQVTELKIHQVQPQKQQTESRQSNYVSISEEHDSKK